MDCFFCFFYDYCSVYWTTLCSPLALFRRSRTLSAHWCSTSSTPPRTPSAYWWSTPASIALFVKVSPGRACNVYNLTFLCWCEMTNLSATFFLSQTFALTLTDNTFVILKHPVVIVKTFKVEVYLAVSRHFPAQPFRPVLVLAFACICAWRYFLGVWLYSNSNIGCQNFERVPCLILPSRLVESVSSAILCCQSYLQECVSGRGLLHYSKGSVFFLR